MRQTPIHESEAFTLIELIAVVVVVFVLMALLLPAGSDNKNPRRLQCLNNLRQIGIADYMWAEDRRGLFPVAESLTNGGWSELLTNANQGSLCWTNYAIMADYFGPSPGLLICPSDERKPAEQFIGKQRTGTGGADTKFNDNRTLSYFVGVSGNKAQARSLLAGDRNLGGGTEPVQNYGFSPESGQGNDVAIQTNSITGPVCWSLRMHSQGNPGGRGSILLGDCHVEFVTTPSFRLNCQPVAGQTVKWPVDHVPPSPSFRVLFP